MDEFAAHGLGKEFHVRPTLFPQRNHEDAGCCARAVCRHPPVAGPGWQTARAPQPASSWFLCGNSVAPDIGIPCRAREPFIASVNADEQPQLQSRAVAHRHSLKRWTNLPLTGSERSSMSGQRYSRRETMRMLAAVPALSAGTRPCNGRVAADSAGAQPASSWFLCGNSVGLTWNSFQPIKIIIASVNADEQPRGYPAARLLIGIH